MESFFVFYKKTCCFTAKPEALSPTLVFKSGANEQTSPGLYTGHELKSQRVSRSDHLAASS
jgi:hypothetical protein